MTWQSRSDLIRSEQAREDGRFERERERKAAMLIDTVKLKTLAQNVLNDAEKADFASAAGDHEALMEALAFASNHVGFVADEIKALREKLS